MKVAVPPQTLTPPPCKTRKVRVSWSAAGRLFHEGGDGRAQMAVGGAEARTFCSPSAATAAWRETNTSVSSAGDGCGTDGGSRRGSTHPLPAERSDSHVVRDDRKRRKVRKKRRGESKNREGKRETGETREGEHYSRRVGVDFAVVEGDRGAADIDAPSLPNKKGARVLVGCWKALP